MNWPAREVSVHAMAELARWQEAARHWPLAADGKVARCSQCGQCAYRLRDNSGRRYRLTGDDILVQVVAHLRQCHQEIALEW
jgi:hypothetical protein